MAARKKRATKKATKKKVGSSVARNKTALKLHVRKGAVIDGGPNYLWDVELSDNRGKVTAGAVGARNEADARTKARRLVRTLGA